MNTIAPPPATFAHHDRSGGLIAMGILLVMLGLACLLMTGFMAFAMSMARHVPEAASVNASQMIAAVAIYLILSAFFLWTGIGTILARRWARALVLATSILWLAMGALTLLMIAFIAPTSGRAWVADMPAEARAPLVVGLIVAGVFLAIIYIAIPLVLVLFFRSPHVKATCEARDPKARWTDACPMPVLVGVVAMAGGGLNLVAGFGQQVLPLFGRYLTGWPAQAGLILSGCICLLTAGLLYRRRDAGWLLAAAQILFWGVSGIVTFQLGDPDGFMDALQIPREDEMGRSLWHHLWGQLAAWIAIWMGLGFAYLFYVRKFFRPAGADRVNA